MSNKYGRWTLVKRVESAKGWKKRYLCKCDCGKEKIVFLENIKRGKSKSCGCLRKELTSKRIEEHGLSNTAFYRAWHNMKARCKYECTDSYYLYGKRGVEVCDRWKIFKNFYDDMWDSYAEDLTLDRIDPNGDYTPENTRWADWKTQHRNKRNTKYLTYKGVTKPLFDWAEQLGINKRTLASRVYLYGWSDKKAIETPVRDY